VEECLTFRCLATTAFAQTRHIAPSLRLFLPNGLKEYRRTFLLNLSASDLPWSNFRDDCSPPAPAAPSLRPFVPGGSFMRWEPFQCTNPVFFDAPCFRSLRCLQLLLALGGGQTFQNALSTSCIAIHSSSNRFSSHIPEHSVGCPPHSRIWLILCTAVPSSTMVCPSALHERP
jgi:hypothetical protein